MGNLAALKAKLQGIGYNGDGDMVIGGVIAAEVIVYLTAADMHIGVGSRSQGFPHPAKIVKVVDVCRRIWRASCLDDIESGSRSCAMISLLCLDGRCTASGLGVCLRAGCNIAYASTFSSAVRTRFFPEHIVYRIQAVPGLRLKD